MTINEGSKVWEGVYQSFDDVPCESDVFSESIWVQKLIARATSLLADAASGKSVSEATATGDYALPFVAAALARQGAPLRILDFGGGLGTSFIQLRAMLPRDLALRFVVNENETVCSQGRALFKNEQEIRFETGIPENESFDLVHAGSSLHYVDDWRAMIGRFARTGAGYILFADLPAGDIETFVTGQSFHGRTIPARFWNLSEFVACLGEHGFELALKAAYRGSYLERGRALPTSNFDESHRLTEFCQLVFRRRSIDG